jgi:outer membrane protein TolC
MTNVTTSTRPGTGPWIVGCVILAALISTAASAAAQERVTLREAIAMAQQRSHLAAAAASARDAARSRDRAFDAALLPQLSLGGNVPVYNRSIIPVVQPDGSSQFRSQQLNDMSLTMNVSQQLPFSGGELFVSSALGRLQVSGRPQNWSSTPFQVGLRQTLFRPNAAAWNAREQTVRADVAERAFLEAREDIAIATVTAFFDHYTAKLALTNALANASINDTLFALNKGRYEVGKIGENDLLQSELAVLRSRAAVDGARLEYDRTLAALRLQLNLPVGSALEIVAPTDIPDVTADTTVAVAEAMRNRAQVRELELQDIQARRRITEARLNTGFGATVQASMGFNQSGSALDAVYNDLLQQQRFSLNVQMPLVQWGGRSAQIQAARSDRDRTESTARQSREQLIQDAHFGALQLAQARRTLLISAKADTVAALRFEVAKNRYIIGRIGMDNLYQAQTEKDQVLTAYLQALRGYWLAYYRLRRTTLYDFERSAPIR